MRSWLGRLARWLAPSAVAACAGAVIAGVVEAAPLGDPLAIAAATGFFALLAAPGLLAGAVATRALIVAWRPRELAARLIEVDGAAPRLAGWLAVLALGLAAIAWALYAGTWWLARDTELRPAGTGFAEPVFALAAAGAVGALSRPAARVFTALARRLDARWRRGGRATLLSPRRLVIAAALGGALAALAIWWLAIKPRIGPLDTSVLRAPALAVAVAVAIHVAWRRVPRLAGVTAVVAGLAAIALALGVRVARPTVALEIWGERPVAGLAIDQLFDLEAIRAGMPLAAFRPADRPGAAHPDIVLITIDTVRADRTPPYGGPAKMPVLAELAARGTTFQWAFAPSNVTRRSVPAIAIGLQPNRIRGRVVGWALRLDPRHVLIAERLRAAGYDTAGFMCCEGFWGEDIHTGLARGLAHLEIEGDGLQLARIASGWLAARDHRPDRKPLFLWMHLLEPHNWTKGAFKPRTDDLRRQLYDRSLAAADAMLGELLRGFDRRAPDALPIVIVTADHGEALGEHGHDYHSTDLYNSQLRVPLVIAGPGIRHQVVPETVSLLDLVPTILELAGYEVAPGLDGRSLADAVRGARPSRPDTGTAFAAMIKDRSNPGGITAIVRGRWKLIASDDGPDELYDIYADPDEHADVAAAHPELARELRARLDDRRARGEVSPFE